MAFLTRTTELCSIPWLAVACIAIITVTQESTVVSGASVVSPNEFITRQQSCTLLLPLNRLFAPVVTDDKTQEELVPIEGKRDATKFWYVSVNKDATIKVNCGRGNTLSIHDTFHYLRLTCVRGAEFRDNQDELILLSDGIECANPRKPTPIVYRNGTCSGKGTNFDVEFAVDSPPRKFYSLCMDEQTSGTLYSSSLIDGESIANGLVEGTGNRPDFRGQEFYPFAIKQAYKWENAFEHLSDLLGSEDLVNQYFPSQQYRFSRGHLFPNADAIKRFEKHATFYYLNTVPQWQVLNGGNWAIVEQDVRDYAAKVQKTFRVVTGSFSVTTLPDENNNQVQIWLARDNTGKLRLPVPRFVWKVVHDPAASAAVAIVQVNNPWVRARTDILCNDVCDNLAWLRSSDFHVVRKGYTYCCDVNELRRVIPYIPQVQYNSLLGAGYVDNGNDDDKESEEEDEEEDDSKSYNESSSQSSGGSSEGRRHGIVGKGSSSTKHVSRIANSIAELFANIHLGR